VTAQVTPLRQPSRRLRRSLVGIAIGLLLPGVLGACAGHVAITEAPDTAAPDVTESATPAVPGTVLLEVTGSGDKTSDAFSATGDSVDVSYSYKCTDPGSFTLNFYGTNVSPALPDVITDEFGTERSDTTTEQLNGATGPFHVEVVTVCKWTVKVTGAR
jgi:hypothetical protein